MTRLEGKVALVVDGERRLGRAAALAFAREGARVAVGGRANGSGDDTARAIQAAGGTGHRVALDPRDAESCELAVRRVVETMGQLDVLCTAYAPAPRERKPLHELGEAEWDETFGETVTAVALPTRAALRVMKEQRRGAIVVLGSSAALVGVPRVSAYSAGTGVLTNWTRNVAQDGAKYGIRANCLCLGSTYDPIVPSQLDQDAERRISPEEIAPVLVFLASDESRHVTGQVFAADDGMTAWR